MAHQIEELEKAITTPLLSGMDVGLAIGQQLLIISPSGMEVVIAACSCVISDVAPNSLVAGVPAKFKKQLV